jgi:hypothetical protein
MGDLPTSLEDLARRAYRELENVWYGFIGEEWRPRKDPEEVRGT